MKVSLDGMINLRYATAEDSIRFGNNEVLPASKVGTWKGHITMSNGCKHPVTLNHVKYVPNIAFNLFSLTSTAANGGNISNRGKIFILQKESLTITFDTMITTRHGYLCAVNMTPGQMETGKLDCKSELRLQPPLFTECLGTAVKPTCARLHKTWTSSFPVDSKNVRIAPSPKFIRNPSQRSLIKIRRLIPVN
jgi:hypothetical protein